MRATRTAAKNPLMKKARKYVASFKGERFVRPLSVRALVDLTDRMLDESGFNRLMYEPFEPEDMKWRRTLVRKVTSRLVEEDVPRRLLRCIANKLEVGGTADWATYP